MSAEARRLFEAAGKGDAETVRSLLQTVSAEDKNFQSELGETVMTLASLRGHLSVVDLLINAGVDLEKKNKTGANALMWASREGHASIVQRLVVAGADMNGQDIEGSTALMAASNMGRKSVVEVLVNAGADLEMRNNEGMTVLIVAAFRGHSAIVDYLIRSGVNIEQQTTKGYTALMMASKEGYKPTVEVLLKFGANMDVRAADRKTAMDVAKNEDMKKLLRGFGRSTLFGAVLPSFFGGKKATPVPPPAVAKRTPVAPPTPVSVAMPPPSQGAATVPAAASTSASPPPHSIPANPAESTDRSNISSKFAGSVGVARAGDATATPSAREEAASTQQAAEFTEQDRAALNVFFKTSAHHVIASGRLNEVMMTVTAHEKALHMLVGKQKECPSLFWFYPKKRELRNWLSNPAKCLFQDTLMMVVVCPVTLCVVECGPKGAGWEITVPKQWVKQWGPAIMFSIYVMQTAVLAGRVIGIPLPQLPSVANLTGLNTSAFGAGIDDEVNQENMMKCLTQFADTTASVLEQTPAMQRVCESINQQGKQKNGAAVNQLQLAADLPQAVMDESYKSIHTYLTTGDNAQLGKLEDQLRGRMERIMAPNGEIEWVSEEGREIWLQKNQRGNTDAAAAPAATAGNFNAKAVASSTSGSNESWLAEKLGARGVNADTIKLCETKLIVEEDFSTEEVFASLLPDEFNATYLTSIGISAKGLQLKLIGIHKELYLQYNPPSTCTTPTPTEETASLSKGEKAAFLKMQDTVLSLTSQLNKLKAATGSTNNDVDMDVSVGGGQMLKKAQKKSSSINPKTRQPYTIDDLTSEVLRLNREIENVASATDERLGMVEQALCVQQEDATVAVDTSKSADLEDKKRSLFSH